MKPGAPNGSFIQATNLMIATLGSKNLLELASADGTRLELKPEQDFYPQRFSASGSVRAPLVYAGFGIHAPRLGYDDYGDRAKGRIALILEHEPGERDPNSPFDGVVTAEAAVPIKKVLAAQEKGVIGVLFVTDVHNHPDPAISKRRPAHSGQRSRRASIASRWRAGPTACAFRSGRCHQQSQKSWSAGLGAGSRTCRKPPKRRAASNPSRSTASKSR